MADRLLPLALIGLAHAAPQGGLLGPILGPGPAVTTSATAVVVPVPVVNANPAAATAAVPAVSSVSVSVSAAPSAPAAPNAPAIPNLPVAPSLPVAAPALPSLPVAAPALPSLPAGLPPVPALPSVAPPPLVNPIASGVPKLPVATPDLNLPALLQTSFPTASILPIDIKTLVPLANTDIISTLAALPANAEATAAISSALAALPTQGLPSLPEVPTGVLPGGLPEITAPASLLELASADVLDDVISVVVSALSVVASVAGAPTPAVGLPSSVLSVLDNLPTGAVGVPSVPTAPAVPAVPAVPATPAVPAGNVSLPGRSQEKKRQVPNPLAGVTGAAGSIIGGAGLGAAVGGLTSNHPIVGNVANALNGLAGGATPLSPFNSLLSSSGGPLGIGAVVASSPIGSIIPSGPAGIQSIVLSTTKDIPIVGSLEALTAGIRSAATAPLTDALSAAPVFGPLIRDRLSLLNFLGLTSSFPLSQLMQLTNVAALQTLVQFINPKDLALASYILGGGNVLAQYQLGNLLSNPTDLIKAISAAAPLADNLPAVASYMILSDLGATGIQNVVSGIDASAVQNLLTKLPAVPAVGTGLPVKE